MSTFAIDYDGTWTADPGAFRAFATLLRSRGHRVIIVTARVSGHGEVEREAGPHVDRVLFSGPDYKREHAEAHGEHVNVWIDDLPGTIGPEPALVDPWGEAERAAQGIECDEIEPDAAMYPSHPSRARGSR